MAGAAPLAAEDGFSLSGGADVGYRRILSEHWATNARLLLCIFRYTVATRAEGRELELAVRQSRALRENARLEGMHLVLSVLSIRTGMAGISIRELLDCRLAIPSAVIGESTAVLLALTLALRSEPFDITPWMPYLEAQAPVLAETILRFRNLDRRSAADLIARHVGEAPAPGQLNTAAVLAGLLGGFAGDLLPGIMSLPPSVDRDVLLYAACLHTDRGLQCLPLIRNAAVRLGAARLLSASTGPAPVTIRCFADFENAALPRADAALSASAEEIAYQCAVARAISEVAIPAA